MNPILTYSYLILCAVFKEHFFRNQVYLDGGGKRDRTADLLLARQALSQLSYTPTLLT